MGCIQCDSLLSEYWEATERYVVLAGMLARTAIPEALRDLEFQKLKDEVAKARLHCHRTRIALHVHKESPVCRRPRLSQRLRNPARTGRESVASGD